MERKRIASVRYSNITRKSLTVVVVYDDDTFVIDHPILVSYANGSETVKFDFPERLPETVRTACVQTILYTRDYDTEMGIREAITHGHPEWSHVYAYGPCVWPTEFAAERK